MAKITTPATFDHAGWNAVLNGKDYRTVGHNTWVVRLGFDGDATAPIALRYHTTNVVTFYPDGTIMLNSGGYRTATTKQRMNAVLPGSMRVFQKDFDWFVKVSGFDGALTFEDGMTFDPSLWVAA